MDENELDIDVRLLRELMDKLEQQLTSICSGTPDHSHARRSKKSSSHFIASHIEISILR